MTTPTPVLVERFARSFDARYGGEHTVTSPLGLWLLIALAAPASDGEPRLAIETALGTDAADAARRAAALLAAPHPAVASAAAVWADQAMLTPAFGDWAAGLPDVVGTGPVPDRRRADAWCEEVTQGLIRELPAQLDPSTAAVVVTALAARVTWIARFEEVPPERLGGEFAALASTALATPDEGHDVFLARTDAAGLVAAHVARATTGLLVVSVVAAPDVAPAAVHAAAGEVAATVGAHPGGVSRRVSAFDVPVGPGHAWTVTEATRSVPYGEAGESGRAVLPAWTARGEHDLLDAPGVDGLLATLGGFLRPDLGPAAFEARQVAVASFTAEGFDAAAVTTGWMAAGAAPAYERAPWRELEVRFNRPYAVVAVADDRGLVAPPPDDEIAALLGGGPVWRRVADPVWAGVPVFSAWVARPA